MSMSNYINFISYSNEHIEEIKLHQPSGSWIIGNEHMTFKYYNGQKPHWFHRLMARILLGWKWVNEHE